MVDGSNESLAHADEDLDTLLQKYSPLQKIFKKSSVVTELGDLDMHIVNSVNAIRKMFTFFNSSFETRL